MIQHITKTHLDMLTDTGRERLREWWSPEEGDWCLSWPGEKLIEKVVMVGGTLDYETVSEQSVINANSSPLPSIGQLIQFLDEHKVDFRIDGAFRGGYYTFYDKFNLYDSEGGWENPNTHAELIELLWDAAITILNRPKEVK